MYTTLTTRLRVGFALFPRRGVGLLVRGVRGGDLVDARLARDGVVDDGGGVVDADDATGFLLYVERGEPWLCLLYTSPSPRDRG